MTLPKSNPLGKEKALEVAMGAVPAGGPSTINGVLYQLLFALVSLGGFRARNSQLENGNLQNVTLIVEPSSGGDQQDVGTGSRIVTQLKARSDEGAWSLQEVVRDVLPDLYLAVDPTDTTTEYRFVTEGRRGDWAHVEQFFRGLPHPAGILPDSLNNAEEVRFGRSRRAPASGHTPFWDLPRYTQHTLFEKIVATLRERKPAKDEPLDLTRRKAYTLLRGFRFEGGITRAMIESSLDRWLRARRGVTDNLTTFRDGLLLDLGRRACSGDALVAAVDFFTLHGLADITPLTDWAGLTVRARDHLQTQLRLRGGDSAEDVRPALARDVYGRWGNRPILVLTGDSGTGKTWLGYALLAQAFANGCVVLLVDARGDAASDLAGAAEQFWHHVVGTDETTPLIRIRDRLRALSPNCAAQQLCVLVDGVAKADELRELVQTNWEGLNVRLIVTVPHDIAGLADRLVRARGVVASVPDFDLAELDAYLEGTAGVDWSVIPPDVRQTLRRPLLARLYRELTDGEWRPRHEYELYDRAWHQLTDRGIRSFDLDGLRRLSRLSLEEGRYPWLVKDILGVSLDNDATDRLTRAGWIRATEDSRYEVWHDRLLNWTVAVAVAQAALVNSGTVGATLSVVARGLVEPIGACGRPLTYAPLDLLWLLCASVEHRGVVDRALTSFETALGARQEVLWRQLLPTLGPRALPLFFSRLESVVNDTTSAMLATVVAGAGTIVDPETSQRARGLLDHTNPRLRRAGAQLLVRCPTADALDRLWALHTEAVSAPEPYLWPDEHRGEVYEDTFAALVACARIHTGWLEGAITRADSAVEPVYDLAYLLANAGNAALWGRCKATLFAKVDREHERSLASNVLIFRDTAELGWLEARVSRRDDLLGPVALRAIIRTAPSRALELLGELNERELYFTREWSFAELHARLPDETSRYLAERLRAHANPWELANVLQRREHLLDSASFDALLNRLTEMLRALPTGEQQLTPPIRSALSFINHVAHPELLNRLRARRGTPLEQALTEWSLDAGPQRGQFREYDKNEALDALARIGGEGFTRVIDAWLASGDWYPQSHALLLAARRPAPSTTALLIAMTELPDADGHPSALRGHAAACLAAYGNWQPVLRYCLRTGLRTLLIVLNHARDNTGLPDEVLQEALAAFRPAASATAGAVFAITFSGRSDLLPEIRAILRVADPASNVARACAIALDRLGDRDPAAVRDLVRLLPHHDRHAVNALLANSTDAAETALLGRLTSAFDPALARSLLTNRSRLADVAGLINGRLVGMQPQDRPTVLQAIVEGLSSEARRALADEPLVFDVAQSMAFASGSSTLSAGVRAAAIRIVAERNSRMAFEATAAGLRAPDPDEREQMAYLLAELDLARAGPLLMSRVEVETATRVRHAIGRALVSAGGCAVIQSWLTALSASRRLAACRVAGFVPPNTDLSEALRRSLDDPDSRVAEAAGQALERLHATDVVVQLVEAFRSETDVTHRWTILDALLVLADPGDSITVPTWVTEVRTTASVAMRRHLDERLRESRERTQRDLDWRDRGRE